MLLQQLRRVRRFFRSFAGFWILSLCIAAPAADAPPMTLSNLWTLKVGGHSDAVPAIGADGTIYLGNFDGKLWAVNPDGRRKWVFETRKAGRTNLEIRSSPVIGADGTIYFGCRDNRVYALRSDGSLRWSLQTGGWVDSSPAIGGDGTVYVGSWDGNLYAFSPEGARKWQFTTSGEVVSSPAVNREGKVAFGSHDGKFYCLNADGTKAWDYNAGGQIISSPAIDSDGAFYITSVNGMFHAVNPDGSSRWKLKTGGITESSPVIAQNGSIVLGVNKDLWCISRDGKKLWEHPATYDDYQQPIYSTPLALKNNSFVAVSGYGLLAAYDERPGMVWKYYLYGFGSGGPAIGTDGTVYISMGIPNVGRAIAALSNVVTLAQSPWPCFRGPLGNGRAK